MRRNLLSTCMLLFTCLATITSAQATCSVTLKAGEQADITSTHGDAVTVCLPVNSGTGYSWQLQTGGDAKTLQPTSTYERSGTMPGSPGFTRFTMTPQTAGDLALVFTLVPPGRTGAEAGRAFVDLHVR
jgi:predicted secreted protein